MRIRTIVSKNNERIKYIKRLSKRRFRDQEDIFMLEGIRLIEDAIDSEAIIAEVFINEKFQSDGKGKEIIDTLLSRNISINQCSKDIFEEISDTTASQGIIALAHKPKWSLDMIGDCSFVIVADRIQDPGNLGALFRTAAAANANCVLLVKGCTDLFNPKTIRATMGAVFRLPYFHFTEEECLDFLTAKSLRIVVADTTDSIVYSRFDFKKPLALIIGNEGLGPSEKFINEATEKVKIPMSRGVESLNASVAAGILIYEVLRQRTLK